MQKLFFQPTSNASQMTPHCIVVLPDTKGMQLLLCYDSEDHLESFRSSYRAGALLCNLFLESSNLFLQTRESTCPLTVVR